MPASQNCIPCDSIDLNAEPVKFYYLNVLWIKMCQKKKTPLLWAGFPRGLLELIVKLSSVARVCHYVIIPSHIPVVTRVT